MRKGSICLKLGEKGLSVKPEWLSVKKVQKGRKQRAIDQLSSDELGEEELVKC